MARPVSVLELTPEEKQKLQRLAGSKTGSQRDGLRARIVLRRAEGSREAEVAAALGVSINTVSTWSRRFEQQGLEGLRDRPGRGRKPWLPSTQVRQVITRRSEEHTSELQSRQYLVCRLLLKKKNNALYGTNRTEE